ncbi:MAG TPA: hypothetical protein VHX19_20255, partial [Stellaceae bacterium]|nr:hypothetical protein [Stellaceae bacterium]
GLLPSEPKLRGSPANILGDVSRGKNLSRVFHFGARAHTPIPRDKFSRASSAIEPITPRDSPAIEAIRDA